MLGQKTKKEPELPRRSTVTQERAMRHKAPSYFRSPHECSVNDGIHGIASLAHLLYHMY